MGAAAESLGNNFFEEFLNIEKLQNEELRKLKFSSKVSYIYNPLDYAKETHLDYVKKYCNGSKPVLFLGMNPGPYGMAQNGIPFGDTHYVRTWLKIDGCVKKPHKEHPKKTVEGLQCQRSEVSGRRLWSFFEEVSATPETFFKQCFVHNFCPLAFLSKTGKNVTPPEMTPDERKALVKICDKALHDVIKLLKVNYVIGIGKFAEVQARSVIKQYGLDVKVVGIMHPSPINPAANKGWKEIVLKQLTEFGIISFLKK